MGGVFHQIRTAHETLAFIEMADVNDAFNIWLFFHFLPAGEGVNVMEALIMVIKIVILEYSSS
jgi:hypothetical protein